MKKHGRIPFETIFEETGLLLVGLDPEGRIVHFNAAMEKMSGFTSEEVIGKYIWDFAILDEAREADISYLENFRKGELIDTLEQYLLTKDGRKRLISWRATSAGAGKGRPDIILAAGMDITERRLAEEALASSEGFFRMLIENSLDLVTVLEADARIIYTGPSVERLLGYGQEEIIGRNITEFVHPDDKEAAKAALDFAMARPGVTGDIELRIRHRDGGWRIHEATSFNLLTNPMVEGLIINSRDVTDRKAMEEELRRKSYDLENIMQALPDIYFRFGPDGTVIDFLAGQEVFLYVPPEEFMGRRVWEVLPAEPGEMTRKSILEISEGGNPASFEYDMQSPDGMKRFEARMLPAPQGEVIAVIRDITERSWAEKLVQSQRDLAIKLGVTSELEEVLKASLAAVLEATGLDSGGIYLFEEDTGTLKLMCHQGLTQDFIAKTSSYEADTANARIVMAGEPLYVNYDELDMPLADPAGEEGLKAFASVPIKSEGRVSGSINAASHSSIEISGQMKGALELLAGQIGRAIERATLITSLQESEEDYRVTFESTGSAMVVMSVDGTILDANQEIQKLLGYTRDEVVGKKKYMAFVHPEDLELVKRHSVHLLKGESRGPVRYEARTVRRDGRVLNTIINVSVLPGMGKSVASIVDITDKKNYELELEARAAQLRDFLDIAAHELRHPATLIEGYAMTLEKYGMEMSRDDLADSLAGVVRGVEKLTGVVNDLLDLSRIERGFMSLERGEHAILPLILDAVSEMTVRAGDSTIEVTHSEDQGVAWLDSDKFMRLMVIILDNAVKYSPPGSPIKVSLEKSGEEALVSVMDRGTGIPEKERSRIFDRFYQAEEVLHHSSPGLGLGLYIAKRIVEAHGGRIWCEARKGGGSVFRFTLPLRR
jgi:PAS domain S-box-containing protein